MSTSATLDYESVGAADETSEYRALHSGAVIGIVFAIFGMIATLMASGDSLGLLYVSLLNLPAFVLCIWSLRRIRSAPEQYTGAALAAIGTAMSLVFLIGGVVYGGYVYATEVPDGYTRISFNTMRPDEIQERNGQIVPPDIAALDGKRVFIKGYIRPDSITVTKGINRFLLVRDNNQCCFGALSSVKYFDQVDVQMENPKTVDYSNGLFSMGGVLKIDPQNLARGPQFPVFSLEADYAN
jgi:hypothetical protein